MIDESVQNLVQFGIITIRRVISYARFSTLPKFNKNCVAELSKEIAIQFTFIP